MTEVDTCRMEAVGRTEHRGAVAVKAKSRPRTAQRPDDAIVERAFDACRASTGRVLALRDEVDPLREAIAAVRAQARGNEDRP